MRQASSSHVDRAVASPRSTDLGEAPDHPVLEPSSCDVVPTIHVISERETPTLGARQPTSSPVESPPLQSVPLERGHSQGASPDVAACPLAAGFEARPWLENELTQNTRLSRYQREILEIALDAVQRMAKERQPLPREAADEYSGPADLHDPTMYPSDEVMFFLLGSMLPDTVSSILRDVLLIFGRRPQRSRRVPLRVSFHHLQGLIRENGLCSRRPARPWAFPGGVHRLCQLLYSDPDDRTRGRGPGRVNRGETEAASGEISAECLQGSQPYQHAQHSESALVTGTAGRCKCALHCSDPMAELTHHTHQAMLFQMAGNVNKCAQLSASACLVCSHLGGRYFADLAAGSSQQESLEARQCLGHCYILDKSLSMSLGRRSLLPDMDVNASMLIPPALEMPSTPIFNVYIEFAKIQGAVAREARECSSHSLRVRIQSIQSLCHGLEQIRVKIENVCWTLLCIPQFLSANTHLQFRSQPPHSTDHLLQGEWMGVDFTYFNIMTAITRLHPNFSTDPSVREDCLGNARQSLRALQKMELHGLKCRGNQSAYCLSVSW